MMSPIAKRIAWARDVSILAAVIAVLSATTVLWPNMAIAKETKPDRHVVLIGVPGLQWSDISQHITPNLWHMTSHGAAAAISTRTPQGPNGATCPIAGWFTVSSGQPSYVGKAGCGHPPTPNISGSGAQVPDFKKLSRQNAQTKFAPQLGMLGQAIHKAKGKTAAIGPGAVLAAANKEGLVDRYTNAPHKLTDTQQYKLIAVDVDDFLATGELATEAAADRVTAAKKADQHVGEALRIAPANSTILLAGISDRATNPHLHVALATGPNFRHTLLTANSTRTDGLVTINDIAVTILQNLDIPVPEGVSGRPWINGSAAPNTAKLVTQLDQADLAARANRSLSPQFIWGILFALIILFILSIFVLRNRVAPQNNTGHPPSSWFAKHLSTITNALAIMCAMAPVAAILANILPWWSWSASLSGTRNNQIATILITNILLTILALTGPWRRHILGPIAVVSTVTILVLAADVIVGLGLQTNSPIGYSPINAGRFYGLGNMAFACLATTTLLLIAVIAQVLRKRRHQMLIIVTVISGMAVVLDGAPIWGADFGGVITLVPALLICIVLLAGWQLSALRIGFLALTGLITVTIFAWLDSLRPATNRSHLGAFFVDLLSGHNSTIVIERKFDAMIHTFSNEKLVLIVITCTLFVITVSSWQRDKLSLIFKQLPTLKAALVGIAIVAIFGLVLNDSGTAVPATGLAITVPLILTFLVMPSNERFSAKSDRPNESSDSQPLEPELTQ